MSIGILRFLAITCVASLSILSVSAQGQDTSRAGMDKNPTAEQKLREKAIKEYETWRSTIPDYDLRLYNRVKALNARTVQLRGIVLVLVLMNLALGGLLVYGYLQLRRELRRRAFGGNPAKGPDADRMAGQSSTTTFEQGASHSHGSAATDKRLAAADAQLRIIDRMESRQRKIHRILTNVEGAVLSHKEYPPSAGQEAADLRDLVRDCRALYDQINDAFGEGPAAGTHSKPDAKQA